MDERPRLGYVPRAVHWNRETSMQSLRSGPGRADFLIELETLIREQESHKADHSERKADT
eukprot:7298363-Pyramimonas_sp.AAC.1